MDAVTMKHTPAPWEYAQDDDGQWRIAPGVMLIEGNDGTPEGDEIDQANAAFIIKAVNAYEYDKFLIRELVGSLEEAILQLEYVQKDGPKSTTVTVIARTAFSIARAKKHLDAE